MWPDSFGLTFLPMSFAALLVLWPQKGSLMKTQTRILDNRLYYTYCSGNTDIDLPLWQRNFSVLITVRRVYYGKIGRAPTIFSALFWSQSRRIGAWIGASTLSRKYSVLFSLRIKDLLNIKMYKWVCISPPYLIKVILLFSRPLAFLWLIVNPLV